MLYNLEDESASQKMLGRLLYEAAGQFYLDTARRRLAVHAERRSQMPELNARVAFKVRYFLSYDVQWNNDPL